MTASARCHPAALVHSALNLFVLEETVSMRKRSQSAETIASALCCPVCLVALAPPSLVWTESVSWKKNLNQSARKTVTVPKTDAPTSEQAAAQKEFVQMMSVYTRNIQQGAKKIASVRCLFVLQRAPASSLLVVWKANVRRIQLFVPKMSMNAPMDHLCLAVVPIVSLLHALKLSQALPKEAAILISAPGLVSSLTTMASVTWFS